MDQKRLFLAIAVSLAILLGFQWLIPHPRRIRRRSRRSGHDRARQARPPATAVPDAAAAAVAGGKRRA